MNRTYSELIQISSFEDRFEYLKLNGWVGEDTFGSLRFLNQDFYRSGPWRRFRRDIIRRDLGCDLAHPDHEIHGRIIVVHHLTPITRSMVMKNSSLILDPDNVVCCSDNTHKAIHYGDANLLIRSPLIVERRPNDHIPWRT